MPMTEPAYFTAFKNFVFTRTPSGVLTLRFHTEGGPAMFTGQMHADFPRALYEIGEDRDSRLLVLTGTGDRFMTEIDGQSLDDPTKPAVWDKTTAEGRRIMQRLVDLEMPILAAVNGPAAGRLPPSTSAGWPPPTSSRPTTPTSCSRLCGSNTACSAHTMWPLDENTSSGPPIQQQVD
jgi:hypothetical protein